MGAIAVRLSPRARLTRPLFATAPQYSDRLLARIMQEIRIRVDWGPEKMP